MGPPRENHRDGGAEIAKAGVATTWSTRETPGSSPGGGDPEAEGSNVQRWRLASRPDGSSGRPWMLPPGSSTRGSLTMTSQAADLEVMSGTEMPRNPLKNLDLGAGAASRERRHRERSVAIQRPRGRTFNVCARLAP